MGVPPLHLPHSLLHLRELLADSQRFAGIFHLENSRTRCAIVRGVQHHHQLALERREQHSMPAVFGEERLILLPPRSSELAGIGDGDPRRVTNRAAAGPDHEELARLALVEVWPVRDVISTIVTGLAPGRFTPVKHSLWLPHRF